MPDGRPDEGWSEPMMFALIAVTDGGSTLDDVARYVAPGPFPREEIEAALGFLVAGGVLHLEAGSVHRRPKADEIEALGDRRRTTVLEQMAADDAGAAPVPLDPSVWSAAERDDVRRRARARLDIVDALLWAVEHPHEVVDITGSAPDRAGAVDAVMARGWTEFQAFHILDLTFGRAVPSSVAELRRERERLLGVIDDPAPGSL